MCQPWTSCVKANSYRGGDWLPSGCLHEVRGGLWHLNSGCQPAEPPSPSLEIAPLGSMCMQLPSDPEPSSLLPFTHFHPCHTPSSDFCLWTLPASCSPSLPLLSDKGLAIFASLVLSPCVTNASSFFRVSSSLRGTHQCFRSSCNNTFGCCSKIMV